MARRKNQCKVCAARHRKEKENNRRWEEHRKELLKNRGVPSYTGPCVDNMGHKWEYHEQAFSHDWWGCKRCRIQEDALTGNVSKY